MSERIETIGRSGLLTHLTPALMADFAHEIERVNDFLDQVSATTGPHAAPRPG
jgi:hypothetical protein